MFDLHPYMPFGGAFHILGFLVWAFFMMILALVVIAIVALLVRYLLVATRAHKLYIANNTPAAAVADEPMGDDTAVTPETPPAV